MQKSAAVLLLQLSLWASSGLGQTEPENCFVPGACRQSNEVAIIPLTEDSNACLASCVANVACYYFTYDYVDDLCILYADCVNLDDTVQGTVSGHVDCPPLDCDEDGQCQGELITIKNADSASECLDECVLEPTCNFYSYNYDSAPYCALHATCTRVDTTCTNCVYGQRECREGAPSSGSNNVLLVFSDDSVVDVISLGSQSCSPVPDLPVSFSYTYSFTTNAGLTPNVCEKAQCFGLEGGTAWVDLSQPSESRYKSAGAQIDAETYWALGGYTSGDTGETYSSGAASWASGPAPPQPLYSACAVTLDDNEVYIVGHENGHANLTNFFVHDWASGTATQLAPPSFSHTDAICGLVQSSNGPEFVVADEYNVAEVYNINSQTWRQTLTQISATAAAYVQHENTFLYMGGSSTDLSIYQWDSATDTFVARAETLTSAKDSYPSAVIVQPSAEGVSCP